VSGKHLDHQGLVGRCEGGTDQVLDRVLCHYEPEGWRLSGKFAGLVCDAGKPHVCVYQPTHHVKRRGGLPVVPCSVYRTSKPSRVTEWLHASTSKQYKAWFVACAEHTGETKAAMLRPNYVQQLISDAGEVDLST